MTEKKVLKTLKELEPKFIDEIAFAHNNYNWESKIRGRSRIIGGVEKA